MNPDDVKVMALGRDLTPWRSSLDEYASGEARIRTIRAAVAGAGLLAAGTGLVCCEHLDRVRRTGTGPAGPDFAARSRMTPRSALYTPAEPPPKVDTGIASVALDDVVFDTFRGGYIPLSRATDEEIEELRDSINPICEPRYGSAESGEWLRNADLVIGYVSQDDAYAYPVKMLNLHEIVNDFIDGVPVLVSYCPLCASASAVVYSRELDGQVLLFGNTSALHESDMVMYDHQTGSYWFQVLGEAIVGPRGSPCFHR